MCAWKRRAWLAQCGLCCARTPGLLHSQPARGWLALRLCCWHRHSRPAHFERDTQTRHEVRPKPKITMKCNSKHCGCYKYNDNSLGTQTLQTWWTWGDRLADELCKPRCCGACSWLWACGPRCIVQTAPFWCLFLGVPR